MYLEITIKTDAISNSDCDIEERIEELDEQLKANFSDLTGFDFETIDINIKK
jgi:hypothetical protein